MAYIQKNSPFKLFKRAQWRRNRRRKRGKLFGPGWADGLFGSGGKGLLPTMIAKFRKDPRNQ